MKKRLDYDRLAPADMKATGSVYACVAQTSLPPTLVGLVYLPISQMHNCACCLDLHTRHLLEEGENPERLFLLPAWHETENLFDARERAALAWAEAVTQVRQAGVPDEAYKAVRTAFDERETVDLTLATGLMNAYNRMAISGRNIPQAVRSARGS